MGRLFLYSVSGEQLLDIPLNNHCVTVVDSEDEDDFLWTAYLDLLGQMAGRIQHIDDILAGRVNTLAKRLLHKGKEVATDGDLASIALEGLVETKTCLGQIIYDCQDVHLELVVPVCDNEAARQELRAAIYENNVTKVRAVLETGQDPNFAYDSDHDSGKTPAMIAASAVSDRIDNRGYNRVLRLLCLARADILKVHEETQRTVLHFAAEANNLESVRLILDSGAASVPFINHIDHESQDAIALTTCGHIQTEIVMSYLEQMERLKCRPAQSKSEDVWN